MTKKITITYYGQQGEGATVKEAKADASQKLEALVKRVDDGPFLVSARGASVLVMPGQDGWNCLLLDYPNRTPAKSGSVYPSGGYATREDAIASAARHALQLAWDRDVKDDAAFVSEGIEAARVPAKACDSMRSELTRWIRFQREYIRLRAEGMLDGDAHQAASMASWVHA